jgi:hypothetical protein
VGRTFAEYSQITDHINAQTPSRRGLLLWSPVPAIMGDIGSRISGEKHGSGAAGAAVVDLSFPSLMRAEYWTVPGSSQYRAAVVSRCRRWRIEVPAHLSVPNQSHYRGPGPVLVPVPSVPEHQLEDPARRSCRPCWLLNDPQMKRDPFLRASRPVRK